MKEQRITVMIDQDGRVTAEAEGFSGDACLKELDRILDGLSAGTASVDRKPGSNPVLVGATCTQTVGKKP